MDFESDLRNIMNQALDGYGYATNTNEPFEDVSHKYFNVIKRRISAVPRTVFEATGFTCPTDVQAGYLKLKDDLEHGNDVNPYLSKSLLDATYNDGMLNDWGISHFHLGDEMQKSAPLVKRTGLLLYAYVTGNGVHCLEISPHGEWAEERLLKTIHDNWPQLIERYHAKGVISLDHTITASDREIVRRNGFISPVELGPNLVYFPTGGGYTSTGLSTEAVQRTMRYKAWVHQLTDWVQKNEAQMVSMIRHQGLTPGTPPEFVLEADRTYFFVRETTANRHFQLSEHRLTL